MTWVLIRSAVDNREDRDNSRWDGLTFGPQGPVVNCSVVFILGRRSVMALSRYYACAVTAVPGPCLFSVQTQWHVRAHRTLSVLFVAWLQPQTCRGVYNGENKKSKGGTEKARIKKRKALETNAAKSAAFSIKWAYGLKWPMKMMNKLQLYTVQVNSSAYQVNELHGVVTYSPPSLPLLYDVT